MGLEEQDQNEPILRGEYERRHQELRGKYETYARRSTRILRVLVLVVLLTAGASAYLLRENGKRTEDITASLIEGCQKNGNPLRGAARTFGHVLIAQTKHAIEQGKAFERTGTYREIFPSYPPDKLHELLVKSRKEERKKIKGLLRGVNKVATVNCQQQFAH